MTEFYPVTELTATNVSGQAEWLRDNNTSDWYEVIDNADPWDARWDMDDPGADLDGDQPVELLIREVGTGSDGTMEAWVYENGSQVESFFGPTATPAGETTVNATFDGEAITDSSAVEIRVRVVNGGGMPSARASADLGYITWDAVLNVFVTVTTAAATDLTTTTATLNGSVDWQDSTVDVWFEWGPEGAGFPNSTTAQTITESGTHAFDAGLTGLSSDTEYEFRAHADRDGGTETDTGAVRTFWTEPEVPAAPTNLSGEFV